MNDLCGYIQAFSSTPVVIVGDLVADEYIHGTTSRISREAPVLIVREERREVRLGGAANVVANVKAMGGEPLVVGVVGDDSIGHTVLQLFDDRGIDTSAISVVKNRSTTTKTRILAGGANTVRQQMLRLDRLCQDALDQGQQQTILDRFRQALHETQGVIVSDYGEGVVDQDIRVEVDRLCKQGSPPVFVDSRFGTQTFAFADTLTPNEPELVRAVAKIRGVPESRVPVQDRKDLIKAAHALLNQARCRMVLVKRGRKGMALCRPGLETEFVDCFGTDEVADVTGAGDTVIAAWSLARLVGAPPAAAMRIANIAGGIKVAKSGTAVVSSRELIQACKSQLE